MHTKRCFILGLPLCLMLFAFSGGAQAFSYPIDISRQLFHDQIEKIQKKMLAMDGRADRQFFWGGNDSLNEQLTLAATIGIDSLREQIETDDLLTHNQKVSYLRGLSETISGFLEDFRKKKTRMSHFPALMSGWQAAYTLHSQQQSIGPVMDAYPYAVDKRLLKSIAFSNGPYIAEAKQQMQLRLSREQPAQAMQVLSQIPEVPFADSLIRVAFKYNPSSVYTFAQAPNTLLGQRILQMEEPGIQLLCTLAGKTNGQLLLPFYDELLSGQMMVEDIEKVANDSLAYFRLLVNTAIIYAARTAAGQTPAVWKPMRDMLHSKSIFPFVNTINALHNAPEATRFRILDKMTAQELYYLIVSSEAEIYTSSYMNVYRRIWQRMASPNADTLLQSVQYDHYKKFITLAANYNTLDHFLSRMSPANATSLMTRFVSNLDQGQEDDLEDAVDVANSYASIKNDSLKIMLLNQIRAHYDTALLTGNRRAQIIYRLENLILTSSEPGSDISLPDSLGIAPVYSVPFRNLLTDTGQVIAQVFFYDDPMVMGIFNGFLKSFNRALWSIEGNEHWVTIRSLKGMPVTIFANRAAPRENGTDERAQKALTAYLERNYLKPTVTIHRGHSYVTNSTIEQMSGNSKIVFLGSCGGYHLIHDVLTTAPEAHIIATKQIGKTSINRPFFQLLAEKLRKGQDIEWIPFWKQLSAITGGNGFEDYIPPHKMLGAIFINAYKKVSESEW